ncbi:hypothetical protein A7985_17305 [Pseudoalteromonas luteoviolacea]|uniref:Uncharacterized protein n=1 Tax=Pseudoalteromonas luteoviolacea TaxID=43657 RepID=A0A1C0TMY1_9GAMM|nr:hypothetical protein [Pseudoalteromonas luteoviolacea]OCQ20188.1 hypothetical protein A7985_17305 [Pseudoalteromonas luteoviolacea]
MKDIKLNQFKTCLEDRTLVVYPCNLQELNDILLFLNANKIHEFVLFWDDAYLTSGEAETAANLPQTATLQRVSGKLGYLMRAIAQQPQRVVLLTGISSIKQRLVALLKSVIILSYFRCPVTFVDSLKHNVCHSLATRFSLLRPLSQFYAHYFICPNKAVVNQLEARFGNKASYIPCEPYNLLDLKSGLTLSPYSGDDVIVFLTGAHQYHNDEKAHLAQMGQLKQLIDSNFKLYIKVHPRDSKAHYESMISDNVKFEEDAHAHLSNKNAIFVSNFSFMNIELAFLGGQSIFLCDDYIFEKYRFWYDLYQITPCLTINEFKEAKQKSLSLGYTHFYND